MLKLNIHEAKTHLSRHLAQLKPGESLLICKHNQPVAELKALAAAPRKPRPAGLARGQGRLPKSFFEPLPDALLDAFNGR